VLGDGTPAGCHRSYCCSDIGRRFAELDIQGVAEGADRWDQPHRACDRVHHL